jgi:hypothetical protein
MKEELCGCCEGLEKLTPMTTANRPGLDALAYRVGTHATFLETLLARLSSSEYPALRGLTTRDPSDPAIALLDAWATVADVLTFYQERIANEGYLRTATERRSILELTRLVGYQLRPGVAASVYLAFTLEEGYEVEIPAGARAQSLPGPGELPQAFETSEPLLARTVWNLFTPRLDKPQMIDAATDIIYLKGTDTGLKPNDPLLIFDSFGERFTRRVLRTETETPADRTKVILTIKGEIDLNLAELERLIQASQTPEEEGPYSVAIGDRAAKEIRAATTNLIGVLKNTSQSSGDLTHAVQVELPRLEQTYRVYQALNFDILADWVRKLQRQLDAILQQLALRPEEPGTPGSLAIDPVEIIEQIRARREGSPDSPRGRPFAREIGDSELKMVMASMRMLIETLADDDSTEEVKALAIRVELPRLAQLQYVFAELGFDDLSSWVDDLHSYLIQAIASTSDGGRIVPLISPTVSLSTLLAPLLKLPARPPVNALRLNRTVARTFAPKADMPLQLLTTFLPVLRPTLYQARRNITTEAGPARVYALRTTASLFGHNVPKQITYPHGIPSPPEHWLEWMPATDEGGDIVFLDNSYDKIMPGSNIVIQKPGDYSPQIYENVEATIRPRTAYGASAKTTELRLPIATGEEGWWDPDYESRKDFEIIRGTVVYAQSELMELAEEPVESDVGGAEIELDSLYGGLDSGRWLIVSGERTNIEGTSAIRGAELVMLAGVTEDVWKIVLADGEEIDLPGDTPHTTIQLAEEGLAFTYKRDTVAIHGNVVKATHGETREEVLGSGDGSQALQTFALKQSPLTYTSAPTPSGIESTLEVRVNDVRWPEVEGLVWLGANDRGYITKTDNEDKTSVIFGDGEHGTRLPTGPENVKAEYRTGIGKPGNVAAEQITLLATKPLGVKSVINPLPATGGADRERRDQARRNAPLAVMALDRLVSVRDSADFARTFAGIGKASAARLSDGRRQLVHVTIAGADDIPIDVSSDLYRNLRQALHQFGDPYQPIQVDVRELMLLVISAKVRLLPDYQWESVEPQIRAALLEAFSFERRELGQDVTLSEAISVIQRVPGVAYVDVDTFDSVPETTPPEDLANLAETLQGPDQPKPRIPVRLAWIDSDTDVPEDRIRPAQLAYLSPEIPDTLILSELT